MTTAPTNPMKPLIFVSHSSRDKVIADAICARLEHEGIRCWIAPRDVHPGRDYSDQIVEALEKASVMVMVFSSGSNTSRHVKSEIDRAFGLGQIIIPFRVENIEPEKGLAYYLSKTHWLDALTPPLESHIDHLAATIRKLTNQETPAAAPAPPLVTARPPPAGNKLLLLGLGAAGAIALIVLFAFLVFGSRQKSPVSPAAQASVAAQDAKSPSIAGAWTIAEARTPEGAPYTGSVRFTQQAHRYQVAWESTAGSHPGIGLARGNKLCAAWGGESLGVVLYKIGGDGTLEGTWTNIGAAIEQSDGLERATGGTPGKIEGRYTLRGTNPGAQNQYGGELEIAPRGDTFQLRWNVNGSVNHGVGIRIEDDLFVAWGDEGAVGVMAYSFEGDRGSGVWTFGASGQTGSEKLIRQ